MLKFPAKIENDPRRKGELASRKQLFGERSRYAVAPLHTRFDAVTWFVWDAEGPEAEYGKPQIIRQEDTLEKAIAGLDQ